MRKLNQFALTVALTTIVTITALGGEIPIGKAPPPPDSPSATAPGEIHIPGDIQLGASSLSAGDLIILGLVQNLLIVF